MRSHRSLVVVVHDEPGVGVAQANELTTAGYSCLVAGDSATALWFALRIAQEVPALYPGVVLVAPESVLFAELPDHVARVTTALRGRELVAVVERAAWMQHSPRPTRITVSHEVSPRKRQADRTGVATCS
jgi:hypothetical protein